MRNIFIDILPPWVETGLQPAFYDLESGTVLQQTARMYAKVRELTEAFNTFTTNVTKEINSFESSVNDTIADYIEQFNQLHDYVDDYFENLDVQEEVDHKLDEMAESGELQEVIGEYMQEVAQINENVEETERRVNTTLYDNEEASLLYAFFDDSNQAISFYTGTDGTNLQKISGTGAISGRDPSIYYKDGKYYIAITNYSSTYDFTIYETEDLKTFTQHNVNVGLYSAIYPKVWAPEWFEDSNGKLYLFLAKQYANTEGAGDFEMWVVECTDLDNYTFNTPQKLTLSGNTSNNHIDGCVTKYNNVYYMILKDDTTTAHTLELYTSSDLITWTRASVDPFNFGRSVEGEFVYKIGNEYYIGAERNGNRALNKSYYVLCKTKDFSTYSSVGKIIYPDEDLSHGSAIVIPKKQLNNLIASNGLVLVNPNDELTYTDDQKNFHIIATQLTVDDTNAGARIGNYLHLFDLECLSNYKVQSLKFRISEALEPYLDCEYSLVVRHSNTEITELSLTETYCSTRLSDKPRSLAGWLIAVKDNSNKKVCHVYMDLACPMLNNNTPLLMEITSNLCWGGVIRKYTDKFLNSIDTSSNVYRYANGSANSRTAIINNGNNTKCRIVLATYNATVKVAGHLNSVVDSGRFDGCMQFNADYFEYINLNSNLRQVGLDVTMTKESYNATTREYTVLIEHLPPNCAMEITIPPSHFSYVKKITYLA